jgi:hypothetical protein
MISLRFCFRRADKGNPVAFFINTKSLGYTPYGSSNDVAIFSLQFTQRPPDDLIEIMGRILDANVNSAKRREERIPITPDTLRKLSIVSKDTAIFMQAVPRNCILRDISFSGAKVIMMGIAKFLLDKEAILKIEFDDPREFFLLKGKFLRTEVVESRKELVSVVILFDESVIPMGYKIRINDFLSQVRADARGSESGTGGSLLDKKNIQAKKPVETKAPEKKAPADDPWPTPDEAVKTPPAPPAKPGPKAPPDDGFALDIPS